MVTPCAVENRLDDDDDACSELLVLKRMRLFCIYFDFNSYMAWDYLQIYTGLSRW